MRRLRSVRRGQSTAVRLRYGCKRASVPLSPNTRYRRSAGLENPCSGLRCTNTRNRNLRRRVVSTFSVVWQCGHSHPNRLSVSSPFSLCHVWPHSVQVISPFGVRRPICSMQFLYPHSICAGVSGGRCLLAATTLCWNFVLGFITKIDWALVCYLRFSWVWTWLSPTWRRLRSRPSVWRSAVPRLFPPRSVQRCD